MKQILWFGPGSCLLRSRIIPFSSFKVFLLRLFSAEIAEGVRIKPGVRVKFPWRLKVGSNSWIGEDVWIDNLAEVRIGSNCCLSQGAYLCTGNHHWKRESFDLITKEIELGDKSWIAAKGIVAPGVKVGEGAILGLGSVAEDHLEAWHFYSGVPAKKVKVRQQNSGSSS